jgi:hypothetical protein
VAVLGAVQAFLRPKPTAALAPVAEGSSLSVVADSVRPLFVALAWVDAIAALQDLRLLDALDRLRLLESADPSGWEASHFRAHLIAHNLADREPPPARAARIVEAVRILEAAAARTRDPGPEVARGQLLLEPRLWEADLSRRLAAALGASPRAVALAAIEEAARRAPGSARVRFLTMEAARLAALEELAAGAPLAGARARLDVAAGIAASLGESTLEARLAVAWGAALRSAAGGAGEAIDAAGDSLLAVLSAWSAAAPPIDDVEAVLAAGFARRMVPLAEERLRAGEADAALSLVALVHKIRSFVTDRLVPSHLGLVRDLAGKGRVQSLLDSIASRNPGLQARVSALSSLVSAWR